MPTLTRTTREPLIYELDGTAWKLLADAPGIAKFLQPNAQGRLEPPTENFDEYLAVVIDPEQAEALYEATKAGEFGEALRYDAAVSAWRNTTFASEIESVQYAMLRDLKKQNARMKELIAAGLAKANEDDAAEVEPDPLEG